MVQIKRSPPPKHLDAAKPRTVKNPEKAQVTLEDVRVGKRLVNAVYFRYLANRKEIKTLESKIRHSVLPANKATHKQLRALRSKQVHHLANIIKLKEQLQAMRKANPKANPKLRDALDATYYKSVHVEQMMTTHIRCDAGEDNILCDQANSAFSRDMRADKALKRIT